MHHPCLPLPSLRPSVDLNVQSPKRLCPYPPEKGDSRSTLPPPKIAPLALDPSGLGPSFETKPLPRRGQRFGWAVIVAQQQQQQGHKARKGTSKRRNASSSPSPSPSRPLKQVVSTRNATGGGLRNTVVKQHAIGTLKRTRNKSMIECSRVGSRWRLHRGLNPYHSCTYGKSRKRCLLETEASAPYSAHETLVEQRSRPRPSSAPTFACQREQTIYTPSSAIFHEYDLCSMTTVIYSF